MSIAGGNGNLIDVNEIHNPDGGATTAQQLVTIGHAVLTQWGTSSNCVLPTVT